MKKRTLAGILAAVSCLSMTACASPAEKPAQEVKTAAQNLSTGVSASNVTGRLPDDAYKAAQTGFSLNLFQKTLSEHTNQNVMISPYSVMQALAMTANGAKGETLSGMEQALGGLPLAELNEYLFTQRTSQPNAEGCKLTSANSIWLKEGSISVKPEFLQKNADYFGSEVFQGAFNESTVTDINAWVSSNTDNMIRKMLDNIPPEAVMYLINAVCFDAKWEEQYTEDDVSEREFRNADGTSSTAQMMYSTEYAYLQDGNAAGFYKPYEGGRYAFAAILPDEGVRAEDYVQNLTADRLQTMLAGKVHTDVSAGIPEFTSDFSTLMNDTLIAMGMENAFDERADFSGMAEQGEECHIGNVLHKTHIEVDPKGTKAAAVTAVEVDSECCIEETEIKYVILDRPFVYMIVDTETDLPIFIGILNTLEQA